MKKIPGIVCLFPLLVIYVLLSLPNHAQAQNKTIDSLQKVLETAQDDTNKVKTLNRLGWKHLRLSNYNDALHYVENAKVLAEKLNYTVGLANSFNNIGNVYREQGNFPEALKNFFASLKLSEEISDKKGMAIAYGNIGLVYTSQSNYSEALKYQSAALKIYEEIGDKRGMAVNHGNIGNSYAYMGNFPEALKSYSITLKFHEEMGDQLGIAYMYNNIGEIYSYQGNYTEALKNHFAALKIKEERGDKRGTANSYTNIGNVYTKLKQLKEAKKWLQKGLDLGRQIGARKEIKDSYFGLVLADSALENYQAAFENYKMYILYSDSMDNDDYTRKSTQLEMQFEFDKNRLADSLKNMEVQKGISMKLQEQKTYTYAGIGSVILLMVFLFFIARERKKSENLLLNILPTEIAKELKEKGNVQAKHFDNISVLFTDFVNFTQIAEQLSPNELVQELHACFTAFDRIMEKHGLEKIKTIGDAYLAVCGLPHANPHHAQKTVQAALEISSFMLARKEQASTRTFEIRIGIHSGSVVAGIVGVKKFAYDIWGDTVNTAARMEASGEAGKINISETTYQLVKDEFTCTYRGKIQAKNKGEVDMYFVYELPVGHT